MPPEDGAPAPGRAEAIAAAVAGPAFAGALLLLRSATPVPAVVFDALAALVLGYGLAPLAHRVSGAPGGTLLRGGSLALAAFVLFRGLGESLGHLAIPLALGIGGATILQADARRPRGSAAWTTAGSGLLVCGLALAALAADLFPHAARLRGALTLAAGISLAGAALRVTLRRTRHRGLAPTPAGILAVAALLGSYLAYRPLALERVAHLPLYEWGLAVTLAALLFGRIRRVLRDAQAPDAWSLDARRHAQDTRPLYDPRMMPLAGVFQRWLDEGIGFDEYKAALERAHGGPLPRAALEPLEAARGGARGLPKARREAAQRRLAAHEAIIVRLTSPERGAPHGRPPRPLR